MSHRPVTTDCLASIGASFGRAAFVAPTTTYAVFDSSGVIEQGTVNLAGAPGPDGDDSTAHRICSMSKSFTAAVTLILRDAGRLSLSDPVRAHVPEFPTYVDATGHSREVTIEMLLSNSSGLPEDNPWADHHLDMTREDLRALLEDNLRFASPPGEEYHYSNTGFATVGLVIESVTGEDYLDVVDRLLLGPLGMTSTSADPASYRTAEPDLAPRLAPGRESFDGGRTWHDRPFVGSGAFAPGGSLCSTVADVARWGGWLASAFSDTDTDSEDVLSAASRREMQRLRTSSQVADRRHRPELRNVGYGYGLNVEQDERFGAVVQHSGGLPGASSHMRWHAASGLGIVVLSNATDVPVAAWAAGALRSVLIDVDAPARVMSLWPETWEAAAAVDDVIRRGASVLELDAMFTANVLSDLPADLRDARIRELVAQVGPLAAPSSAPDVAPRTLLSRSPSQLTWWIGGAAGRLRCRIEMTAVTPTRVQRLDVVADSDDDSDAHTVVSHYLVRPPR
jgi:CubicO group peptidase (beta-lactamase class C family)